MIQAVLSRILILFFLLTVSFLKSGLCRSYVLLWSRSNGGQIWRILQKLNAYAVALEMVVWMDYFSCLVHSSGTHKICMCIPWFVKWSNFHLIALLVNYVLQRLVVKPNVEKLNLVIFWWFCVLCSLVV